MFFGKSFLLFFLGEFEWNNIQQKYLDANIGEMTGYSGAHHS
jgi:hypothetical protein